MCPHSNLNFGPEKRTQNILNIHPVTLIGGIARSNAWLVRSSSI